MVFDKRNNKILIIAALLAGSQFLHAQTKPLSKALKKKMEAAAYYFQFENYHLALPVLLEIYAEDSTINEVNYKTGVCLYHTRKNKTEALKYFEKAQNIYIDAYYYLGNIYHLQMQFDKAITSFQYYKYWYGKKEYSWDDVDYLINKSITAKEFVRYPGRVTIRPVGDVINSKGPDYVPLITANESVLFFTSRREGSTGGLKDPFGEYFEDIYFTCQTDSSWTTPQNIGAPINTSTHDACVAVTSDGHKLFIYRPSKNLSGGHIYYTEKNGDTWTEPEKIDAEINTKDGLESSGTISPDENIFYFSSNRPGGYGGKDLYRVVKFPDGKWSKAMNLGPTINTQYDEDAPFIHPDGNTLYFSSRGHKNMGGFDIFRSLLKDEVTWSNPENAGYPVNTVFDDLFFVITADNMRGYYSCDKEGTGNTDIYEIDMPENQSTYRLLKGVVISNDSIPQTIPATITITLIDNTTNTLQGVYRTNKETGKYLLIVEPRKKYKIIVEAEDYESIVDMIEIPDMIGQKIIMKDIILRKKLK